MRTAESTLLLGAIIRYDAGADQASGEKLADCDGKLAQIFELIHPLGYLCAWLEGPRDGQFLQVLDLKPWRLERVLGVMDDAGDGKTITEEADHE